MFCSFRVLVNGLSISIFVTGYVNFLMLLPYMMVEQGFSYQSAAWVISISSAFNTLSRASMTVFADKPWFKTKIAYMISSTVAGIFNLGMLNLCKLFNNRIENLKSNYYSKLLLNLLAVSF